MCKTMVEEIDDLASDYHIPHTINSISSMFQIFFSNQQVVDYNTAKKSNIKKLNDWKNILDLIPPKFKKTNKLKKTGYIRLKEWQEEQ